MRKPFIILFIYISCAGISEAQNAQMISPAGASYIDPEFLSSENKMAFQTTGGYVWLSDLDPFSGLPVTPTGLDILIDTGATPLIISINGPEFGTDQNGWSVFYTKPNGSNPQTWRADYNGTTVTRTPLTAGNDSRLSALATKAPGSDGIRLLYSVGPSLSNGQMAWTDEDSPADETVVDSADNGVRWIDGTRSFVYIKQTGTDAGQLFFYDTETQNEIMLTNDTETKTYSYGWYASEYDNELLVLAVLNDTAFGIYKDTGGQFWEKIMTIPVPPLSSFDYIGSPEPFVAGGKSYISFVTKVVATGSFYVQAEVWVTGIEQDTGQQFMLRCDDGAANTKRTDPESFIGDEEVFIYYNVVNENGKFEIWRYATGIPVNTTDINDQLSEYLPVIYPNPVTDRIHINNTGSMIKSVRLYNARGQLIREYYSNDLTVEDLSQGMYILKIQTEKTVYLRKLVKQ